MTLLTHLPLFSTGLTNFLTQLRKDYPSAALAAMCSPSAHGPQCANIQTAATNTKASYLFLDHSLYDGGLGCDSHPNIQSQANIASVVTPFVQGLLGL